MSVKYRIHNAPSAYALDQAARIGSNMAIVYSVGPCSHLTFERDPVSGRTMDEFPIYFDDYPKIAELRRIRCGARMELLGCARALAHLKGLNIEGPADRAGRRDNP